MSLKTKVFKFFTLFQDVQNIYELSKKTSKYQRQMNLQLEHQGMLLERLCKQENLKQHTQINDLLKVIDYCEQLLEAAEPAGGSIQKEMIREILLYLRSSQDLTPLAEVGHSFDPNFHTVIQKYPHEVYEQGKITKIFSQGYRQGQNHLVRLAQVGISS